MIEQLSHPEDEMKHNKTINSYMIHDPVGAQLYSSWKGERRMLEAGVTHMHAIVNFVRGILFQL